MKRITILLASLALVASGFQALPAAAQDAAPAIPEVVNIDDPAGDANTQSGDQVLPVGNVSNVGDILKVWFTNDATKVNVHFQTALKPPGTAYGFDYRVEGLPGADDANCLRFRAIVPGGALVGDAPLAKVFDMCNDGANWFDNGVEGEVVVADGPDGTGITTMTFDRSALPEMLGEGATITAPAAWSYAAVGSMDGAIQPVRMDDTKVGTDYAFVDGDAGTPPKTSPPGKKKGCDKGKGKKRGCEGKGKKAPKPGKPKKPAKPAACTPIEPSTAGAEAPAITLTDAATAEEPLVQPVTLEQRFDEGIGAAVGAPGSTEAAPASVNVTVDTSSNEPVGLYATLEFPARRDYDLWAYFPGTENEEAASSHGFNPLIETQGTPADQSNTATNHGGETTASSENLVGILTPDCGGYTISAYNYFGEGGDMEVKLWLGEVKYDPAETAADTAAARAYEAMLLLL